MKTSPSNASPELGCKAKELQDLRTIMRSCEQMRGLSVLAHGQSVAWHYRKLIRHLRDRPGEPLAGWRWPAWLTVNAQALLNMQIPYNRAIRYQIYHDCGKPGTQQVDEAGRQHFPDHANASACLFTELFPDLSIEGALIKEDMRIHTMAAAEIAETLLLKEEGYLLWPTLLLTALCELHANALMFGGVDTSSFKAKFSQIDRRGKALCKSIPKMEESLAI